MKTRRMILFSLAVAMFASNLVGGSDDSSSLWTSTFTRRLDHGYLKTPFVDPDHPPQVELVFLSWDGKHLIVGCDFHNLGTQTIKIEGREISDEANGTKDFYPYATLEVSNNQERDWTAIGTSPPNPLEGRETAIFAPPNPPNQPVIGYRGSFEINLNAFRAVIGKFEFGRVVLKNGGGTSQIIVLTDLLPPKEE